MTSVVVAFTGGAVVLWGLGRNLLTVNVLSPLSLPGRGFFSYQVFATMSTLHVAGAKQSRSLDSSVLSAIGRTPLLRLQCAEPGPGARVRVFGKAEFMNPGGSVKDRPALRIVKEGIESGRFDPNRHVLIDATSGNTGIAYAMLGAAMSFTVELAIPANASSERKRLLRSLGATLHLTDPLEGTDGAQAKVRNLVAKSNGQYFYPDQYNNEANWRSHFETTGPEILQQTNGEITHFITGLGTTGTFMGVSRYLQQFDDSIARVAMQPDSPLHGLEGLKHMATDQVVISTSDAYAMTRRMAREEGLMVGPSAGANVAAAARLARSIDVGTVVTILCDTGSRYLSDSFWDEPESATHVQSTPD